MATQTLGKNVFAYKITMFTMTSTITNFNNALYSNLLKLATPNIYSFNFSLTIFTIVIFDNITNLSNSMFGTIIIVLLDPFLQQMLKLKTDKTFVIQLIVYNITLTILMHLHPQNLFPKNFSIWHQLQHNKQQTTRIKMNTKT